MPAVTFSFSPMVLIQTPRLKIQSDNNRSSNHGVGSVKSPTFHKRSTLSSAAVGRKREAAPSPSNEKRTGKRGGSQSGRGLVKCPSQKGKTQVVMAQW